MLKECVADAIRKPIRNQVISFWFLKYQSLNLFIKMEPRHILLVPYRILKFPKLFSDRPFSS